MRRAMFILGLALAFGVAASPADAQFKFGVHANYIAGGFGDFEGTSAEDFDFGGDFGVGGRLAFSPPLFPLGVFGDVTYFFPDCGTSGDCSYWNAQVGAQLGLPLPMIRPYVLGGWQWKSFGLDGFDSSTDSNPFVGVGVEIGMLAGLFIEGQMEFDDEIATDIGARPFVLRAGLLFGG